MGSSTSTSELRDAGLRIFGALAVVLVLLVAIELVLRMLPIVSGVHRHNPQSPAASARLLAHRDYTWSLGWDLRHVVRGRTNAMGFPSPHEYTPDKHAVALLGDSFVEALMLRYDKSLAGHLAALWGGRVHSFNFGLSGVSLPHYLGMAREMGSRFTFDAASIVISPSDYAEGFEAQDGLYKWHEDPERDLVRLVPAIPRGGFRQLARELALVRYMRAHLKLTPSQLLPASEKTCVPQALSAKDRARLTRYVDALPQALRLDPDRVVLVFTAPTSRIYERVDRNRQAGERCADLDTNALAELRQLAASRGMKIVDVAEVLEGHYRVFRRQLDFRPVDSHWNGVATAVIAHEIARVLAARDRTTLRTASPD
jgi:hypothetical protein